MLPLLPLFLGSPSGSLIGPESPLADLLFKSLTSPAVQCVSPALLPPPFYHTPGHRLWAGTVLDAKLSVSKTGDGSTLQTFVSTQGHGHWPGDFTVGLQSPLA